MTLFLRLLKRQSYTVSLNKAQSSFLYRERGRTMRVSGETMADGYAVYASSIREWDSVPEETITDSERQRIAANIRAYFTDRGKNVYIS